jgi:hypothetical protein
VLTTVSPVTQFADVAVKRAFKKPTLCPFWLANGKLNKHAPTSIMPAKLMVIVCGADK